MAKVTVVTVCYNSEKTIKDTLESVTRQNHLDIEYLVVDGKSRDNTLDIAESYREKLPKNTVILSEKDKGIYDAMNKGISRASGDIVGFLNSDDVFAGPDAIAHIAKTFQDTNADIIYGNIVYTKQDDLSRVTRTWRTGEPPRAGMRNGWHPPHPAFYVKRDVLQKLGGFKLNFPIAADYEMMVRLIAKHQLKTAWCDNLIVRMREGGNSNAGIKAIWRANIECWRAWKENGLKPSPGLILGKLASKLLQYG
jgi:glycosyltransferase involved in cell wall biosynthesis